MAEVNDQVTEWTVGGRSVESTEQHPHVPLQKVTDDMTESQKNFITVYNSMRNMLMKHGMMVKK